MFLDETFRVKVGLAEMLKGGVIMDVTNADQALIAEKAGAAAVMLRTTDGGKKWASPSAISKCRSCAARVTSARPCAVSPKARP